MTGGTGQVTDLDDVAPFGHVCRPDDVANVVAFLVSEAGGYITGERIRVDGGTPGLIRPRRTDVDAQPTSPLGDGLGELTAHSGDISGGVHQGSPDLRRICSSDQGIQLNEARQRYRLEACLPAQAGGSVLLTSPHPA